MSRIHLEITRLTFPVADPVSVEQLRGQARIDHAEEDETIAIFISAARELIENETGMIIGESTLIATMDHFPSVIRLPVYPIVSIDSVKYYDVDGVQQTLATSIYQSDIRRFPARIRTVYDQIWPDVETGRYEAVEVAFTAGYDDYTKYPVQVKQIIRLLAADWYKHREETTGIEFRRIPIGVMRLIKNLKKRVVH